MSVLKQVDVSGAVGIQVYSVSASVKLLGVHLDAVSATTIVIRDGNASGTVSYSRSVAKQADTPATFLQPVRFDKGMHVKVIGTNAKAYLEIC